MNKDIIKNMLLNNTRKATFDSIDGVDDINFLKKELKRNVREKYKLQDQLEEKQKIIEEIKKYLNNFDTKSLEEQGLGIEVKEFIINQLEILERGKDE